MMDLQFGGDGYLQLRWKLFFCMGTCDIFSLGEWFLTFFVHTDFLLIHSLQKWRNLFKDILQTVSWFFMKFWEKKHHGRKNKHGKFQLNLVHGFQENDHHHLQPIYIFLEIRDVGFSKFCCGDALEW